MKARISLLHKTASEWAKLSEWKHEAGELIVYDPDNIHKYTRIKIGDGRRSLKDLDFCLETTIEQILKAHNYDKVIDGGRITDYV